MKKIGFIDYYIDEFHANNYPRMIRESSFGSRMQVALAWEKEARAGLRDIDQWCKELGVAKAKSCEQVVEQCDYIVVLSPGDPQMHEELADLPLRSGKPVYIDKPIAPTLAAARRLFDKAADHSTPMFSSSSLRFGSAFQEVLAGPLGGGNVDFVATRGGGAFETYAVHQIEMVVAVMGTGAQRVIQTGTDTCPAVTIDYGGGRRALINLIPGHEFQFSASYKEGAADEGKAHVIDTMDDFFERFIDVMLRFFDTGESPVPTPQTLAVAALIEAGQSAVTRPFQWVAVPS